MYIHPNYWGKNCNGFSDADIFYQAIDIIDIRAGPQYFVHPAKIQITLHIRTVWSESSFGAFFFFFFFFFLDKGAKFLRADREK